MKRRFVLVLGMMAFFQFSYAEQRSPVYSSIPDFQDCRIRMIFHRIWKSHPLGVREKGAWIVLNAKGEYEQIDWVYTPQRNQTTWSDALPANIVAQVHTHGDDLESKPSDQDVQFARRLNISVYTVTRKGIWRAAPDGTITKEAKRGWFDRTMKTCGASDASTPSAQLKKP